MGAHVLPEFIVRLLTGTTFSLILPLGKVTARVETTTYQPRIVSTYELGTQKMLMVVHKTVMTFATI